MESTKSSNNSGEGVLYFAYGSNLSPTQMQVRCPSSPPVGLAYLPGWTWLINERGYANIVQHKTPALSAPSTSSPPHSSNPLFTSVAAASPSSLTGRKEIKVEEDEDGAGMKVDEKKSEEVGAGEEEGVYGVLYRLHPDDEDTLDMCEGVPWAYERRFVDATVVRTPTAKTTTGEAGKANPPQDTKEPGTVRVLVYVDFKRVLPSTSKDEYIDRMNRGINEAIEQWGLPKSYVDAVMRPFIPLARGEEGKIG
ncbi:hypothetical protein F5Y13DRAFT_161727 [Hypoxylon sp. FL1857]|nr:hypothetical protein F5Y13DRAFT_161727 [Hypoxylon sp. FL1857]